MIFGVALEVLRKQSNCWDKITECSANCEECECHVDASELVEAVKTVLENFPTEMSGTSESRGGGKMSINEAVEALRKYYGCRTTTGCGSLGDLCDRCEYDVDADTVTEALKTVLDAFGKSSELPNSSADLISRQAAIDLCKQRLYETAINNSGYKCDAGDVYSEMAEKRIVNWLNEVPSVQAEQKWIPCSERMPEEDHWLGGSGKQFSENVLVTIVNHDDEDIWVDTTHTIDGEWILELPRHCEITAWQQLPESYRGDTE